MRARFVFSQYCSWLALVVSRSDWTMALTLSLSSATSPSASTVMERVRSPVATALVTSAIARTWRVRFPASSLTFSVSRFQVPDMSQQLIEHLVTSNPSPQYIARVSNVFLNDGTGVKGNLKAVITAILTDTEARAGDDPSAAVNPTFGHMREPILFMTNIMRGLNATLGPTSNIYGDASLTGESLFHSPSVFSYFSPQYRITGGLLGPEFQIYSTATSTERANLVNAALYAKLDKSTTVDLTPFERVAVAPIFLINYISQVFLHSSIDRKST